MKKILIAIFTLALLTGVVAGTVSAEEATVNRYCRHCYNWVDWSPWGTENASLSSVPAGHYYLTEDIPRAAQKIAMGLVCIDLNGHTMRSSGRALLASRAQLKNPLDTDRAIINIFDSVGGGAIISTGGDNNPFGGVVTVSNGGQVNLYSGTLKYVSTETGVTTCGGVVGIYTKNVFDPEFNMYGGCLDASECVLRDGSGSAITACADGSGAAVAVCGTGVVNLAGGQIIGGTANPTVGRGDCVFVNDATAKLTLSGNAQVEEIYFAETAASSFAVSGAYTGTAKLAFSPTITLENGMDIGDLEPNSSIREANLTCTSAGFYVDTCITDLILSYANPNAEAAVIYGDEITNYDSWKEAFANASGKLVRLNTSISDAVNLTQDFYLDLNGNSITGKVTVADGKTLYCMDSQTDDFTIADGRYGTLTDVLGSVQGLPLEDTRWEDGYLMIEKAGAKSFHRIGLQMESMTLRPKRAGLYYTSAFGGDEMVAEQVSSYGVALSLRGEPTAENLTTDCQSSRFETFLPGGHVDESTSTLLWGIMKRKNTDAVNLQNAQKPIYGRAYIQLKDGTYLFGTTASRSFRQQLEDVSAYWDELTLEQKDAVYAMCKTYMNVVEDWDIRGILSYKDPTKDDVLRILNISNSHGQDSIWLLPAVLKAEMPEQEFVIVELYQGYALTEHIQAARNNSPVYYYYINTGNGWTEVSREFTIEDALETYTWDMIMFNESSRHLGLEEKMSQGMVDWFRGYILDNIDYETQMFYNMTWASPTDDRFYTDATRQPPTATFKATYTKDYGYDHVNHYNKLVELTKKYLVGHQGFDKIIYNATPVQYAGEVLGVPQYDEAQVYDLYRDYTHISDYARLIVAYNLYCEIFDIEELTQVNISTIRWQDRAPWNNRHKKLGDLLLTEQHTSVLIQSVNHGLKNPLSITAE